MRNVKSLKDKDDTEWKQQQQQQLSSVNWFFVETANVSFCYT